MLTDIEQKEVQSVDIQVNQEVVATMLQCLEENFPELPLVDIYVAVIGMAQMFEEALQIEAVKLNG